MHLYIVGSGHLQPNNRGTSFMKNGNMLMIIIFSFALFLLLALFVSNTQPAYLRKNVAEGELYCFHKNSLYCTELSDYCVLGPYIYVLYGDKGILNIYDLEGSYQHSYAFYKTKGESTLRVDQTHVYLFDQQYNYYIFTDGKWSGFVRYQNYDTYLADFSAFQSTEKYRQTSDYVYRLKNASIYRQEVDNKFVPIIKRPLLFALFQGNTLFVLYAVLFIILFLLIMKKQTFRRLLP